MFEPGEVVYAYVKNIYPPKYKYFVTIYKDDNLRIVTCFTTTKNRVGCSFEHLKHGYVKDNNQIVGYFFDRNRVVGTDKDNKSFKFPQNCVIPFDYGVKEGTKEQFLSNIENPFVLCKLLETEYKDIIYAMYKSPRTEQKYKPYLEKILERICN